MASKKYNQLFPKTKIEVKEVFSTFFLRSKFQDEAKI
jgi:hypothetical protein